MTPEQIQIRAAENYLYAKRFNYPSTIIYNYKKTLNYFRRLLS